MEVVDNLTVALVSGLLGGGVAGALVSAAVTLVTQRRAFEQTRRVRFLDLVRVEWKVSTTTSNATIGAQAWVSGAAVGTELVNSAEPTSDTSQTFSVSGLTRAQLLNGVLQIRVRASRGNSNTAFTASLDSISVKVDYTAPATTTMTTNANGNLVAKGADAFTYDQANRLTGATLAGLSETYTYDGDGVHYSRTVGGSPAIRYVSDVNTGLPVTVDDGARKYVYGLDLAYAVSGSTLEIYHTDRLGSVRALTDASGVVTATYRTDEFGVPTASAGSSSQPFGFTGEPRDGTGLTFLRARYYDASLGAVHEPGCLGRCAVSARDPSSFCVRWKQSSVVRRSVRAQAAGDARAQCDAPNGP
jgi:YD repeat-containing protein